MNPSNSFDAILLQGLVGAGVLVLTNCIGIAAAVTFWRRSPKAAVLCLGSMLLMLTSMASNTVASFLLARLQSTDDLIFSSGVLRLVISFLDSVAIGLLITSTFIDRRQNHAE